MLLHTLNAGMYVCVTHVLQVWEVSWGRTGYNGCKKVMDLKGHTSQVQGGTSAARACVSMHTPSHVFFAACLQRMQSAAATSVPSL
jgi:hypothetical protein